MPRSWAAGTSTRPRAPWTSRSTKRCRRPDGCAMAKNYPVDSATTLGRFLLREVKVQQWRIAYLIQCKGVRVYRDRTLVRVDGPDTRLKDGDFVQVDDPLSEACTKALAAIPAADYRDYAFVPGTSAFDKQMAGVLDNRPQTLRINNPLI